MSVGSACLSFQLNYCRACPTLIGRGCQKTRHVWVVFKKLCDRATKSARTMPMNNPYLVEAANKRFIKELIDGVNGFVSRPSDYIQFGRCCFIPRLEANFRTARLTQLFEPTWFSSNRSG